jgi:hypothetical protein
MFFMEAKLFQGQNVLLMDKKVQFIIPNSELSSGEGYKTTDNSITRYRLLFTQMCSVHDLLAN